MNESFLKYISKYCSYSIVKYKNNDFLKCHIEQDFDFSEISIAFSTGDFKSLIKKNNFENNFYFVTKGKSFNPLEHLADEIFSYCKYIIVDESIFTSDKDIILNQTNKENDVFFIITKGLEKSKVAKWYNDFPDKKLKITGITGTDGKTSVVTIARKIFNKIKVKSTSIGTLGFFIGNELGKVKASTPTTPETNDVFAMYKESVNEKSENIFMEFSSIASTLGRTNDIDFDFLVFTNMTQDHLTFHGSLKNYYEAKLDFIKKLSESNKKNKIVIYNYDDDNADIVSKRCDKYDINTISFGTSNKSDLIISNIENNKGYMKFEISFRGITYNLKTSLLGTYNAYNIAVVFILLKLYRKEFNVSIFESLHIDGRLELINSDIGKIYVDYAHTEKSLENVLITLKQAGFEKIVTVFGCGGDRDNTKRKKMGNVAQKYSSKLIVTSDNPRTEKPEKIIEDILKGIDTSKKYFVESDRKKAIEKGIDLLDKDGCLLIAGKGHETYQEINNKKYHFSDKEVIINYLEGKGVNYV